MVILIGLLHVARLYTIVHSEQHSETLLESCAQLFSME